MTDEIILYTILGVMLFAAVAAVVPALLKVSEPGASGTDEAEYREALMRALREQLSRVKADYAAGRISEAEYNDAVADIERRTIEEHRAVTEDPNAVPGAKRALRLSAPALTALVVAGMVGVSVGSYGFLGVPEMMSLTKGQAVLDGTAGIETIETYLKDNEKDGRAWVLLARRYVEKEDYPRAADAYREGRRVMSKVREDPVVMMELGATLLTIGSDAAFKEALPVLKAAHEKVPDNLKVSELYAMAASVNGEWAAAAQQLRLLLAVMTPDMPEYVRYEQTIRMLEARAAAQNEETKAAP